MAKDLLDDKIGYCGSIRGNRKGLPEFAPDKNMKRGEYDWRMDSSGVSITKWKDNKGVLLVSNMHDPSEESLISRRQKDGSIIVYPGTVVNRDYNKHMGYVDKADMMKSFYELDRKSKKWWHRIFFHLLDVTVANSFIIYRQVTQEKINLKSFKLSVIQGLAGAACMTPSSSKRKSSGKPREEVGNTPKRHKTKIAPEIRIDQSEHLPIRVESSQRRCNHCSTKAQPHRTFYVCSVCKVPLCVNKRECFRKYHSK